MTKYKSYPIAVSLWTILLLCQDLWSCEFQIPVVNHPDKLHHQLNVDTNVSLTCRRSCGPDFHDQWQMLVPNNSAGNIDYKTVTISTRNDNHIQSLNRLNNRLKVSLGNASNDCESNDMVNFTLTLVLRGVKKVVNGIPNNIPIIVSCGSYCGCSNCTPVLGLFSAVVNLPNMKPNTSTEEPTCPPAAKLVSKCDNSSIPYQTCSSLIISQNFYVLIFVVTCTTILANIIT